jgi:hypothetical protein
MVVSKTSCNPRSWIMPTFRGLQAACLARGNWWLDLCSPVVKCGMAAQIQKPNSNQEGVQRGLPPVVFQIPRSFHVISVISRSKLDSQEQVQTGWFKRWVLKIVGVPSWDCNSQATFQAIKNIIRWFCYWEATCKFGNITGDYSTCGAAQGDFKMGDLLATKRPFQCGDKAKLRLLYPLHFWNNTHESQKVFYVFSMLADFHEFYLRHTCLNIEWP